MINKIPNSVEAPMQNAPQKVVKKKSNKLFMFFLLFFTAILFTLIGGVGYYLINSQIGEKEKAQVDKQTEDEQVGTEATTNDDTNENEITDPYEGWETYTKNNFTLKYPPNWKSISPEMSASLSFTDTNSNPETPVSDMDFQFISVFYDEVPTGYCILDDIERISVNTATQKYTATVIPTYLNSRHSAENSNYDCSYYSKDSINGKFITVSLQEGNVDSQCPNNITCYPTIKFIYNVDKYPNGMEDFLLVMKSLTTK